MSQDFSQDISQNAVRSVGPLYGLPMKVKELMATMRGIKTFYGNLQLEPIIWSTDCTVHLGIKILVLNHEYVMWNSY